MGFRNRFLSPLAMFHSGSMVIEGSRSNTFRNVGTPQNRSQPFSIQLNIIQANLFRELSLKNKCFVHAGIPTWLQSIPVILDPPPAVGIQKFSAVTNSCRCICWCRCRCIRNPLGCLPNSIWRQPKGMRPKTDILPPPNPNLKFYNY